MAELTRADLQAMVDAKAATTPVAANRLAAALVHFTNWSRQRGYISEAIGTELGKPTKDQPRVLSLEGGELHLASQLQTRLPLGRLR